MQDKILMSNRMNHILSWIGLRGSIDARKPIYRKYFSELSWEEFLGIARM
jgi:hypothetical protein